jgi:hypothetical protein
MLRHLYRAIHAPKGILKASWNAVSGNSIMTKRGMRPAYDVQAATAIIGSGLGAIFAPLVGMETQSVLYGLGLFAGMVALPPIVTHLPYAMYCGGAYDDRHYRITQENRKYIEAQKLKSLPPPDTKLI